MSVKAERPLVLVTGAGGYIGAHVVQVLLDNDYHVRGTVRNVNDEKKVGPLKKLSTMGQLQLVEADLTKPETWPKAVDGCQYVMHVASPFFIVEPKDPNDVIKPAVDGTLNVLRACAENGRVKRVVLTSSVAAIFGGFGSGMNKNDVYDENDWMDTNSKEVSTYTKSKTLAEKAAWDFVNETKAFELAVVNPGFVIGPLVHNSECSSADVITRIMQRDVPMLPKIIFPPVDVRDVALAHLRAMTIPEAAGHRHMLISDVVWMHDIAVILDKEFKSQGYCVPTKIAPKFVLQFASIFDKELKQIVGDYGKEIKVDNKRMKEVLKITPIDLKKTLIDMGYSLIERGYVKKSNKYIPRPDHVEN